MRYVITMIVALELVLAFASMTALNAPTGVKSSHVFTMDTSGNAHLISAKKELTW